MTDENSPNPDQTRQPIVNLPSVVSALIILMFIVHLGQAFVFDNRTQITFSLWFGFIPLRLWAPDLLPGGFVPLWWTPLTHALLHGGWEHLIFNSVWLAIFGTPVTRRYGGIRFLIAFAVSAIAGAMMFTFFATENVQILVGASGGVSGLTGVAMRFMFQPLITVRDEETGEIKVLGRKLATFRDLMGPGRARTFILVWIGINALVPFSPGLFGGIDAQIAWQAHLGGFIAGLLIASTLEWSMQRWPLKRP